MIQLLKSRTHIPFMKFRVLMIVGSILLTLTSLVVLLTKGLNFGVDFAGGVETVISLPIETEPTAEKLRHTFHRLKIEDASVQSFETTFEKNKTEFIVHFSPDFFDEVKIKKILEKVIQKKHTSMEVIQFRFSGLEKAYLKLSDTVPLPELETALRALPFGILEFLEAQPFGTETAHEYQLSFQTLSTLLQKELSKDFPSSPEKQVVIKKLDFVGAKVGKDLKTSALLSLLITILIIFIYIFLRFDVSYAPGVVVALIHDVLITSGVYAFMGMEFDLTIVAALLTLAGYSINDTIVVYDRIRELVPTLKGKKIEDIIDIAINQTLSRTIITGSTTLMITIVLWVFGGPVIHGFALALTVGIIVGTYSSVFIASPLIIWMLRWLKPAS